MNNILRHTLTRQAMQRAAAVPLPVRPVGTPGLAITPVRLRR